jgi:hypothetical protein
MPDFSEPTPEKGERPMSKLTVAFLSFVAGLSSALLLFISFGYHTSISAQEPPKRTEIITTQLLRQLYEFSQVVLLRM